MVVPLVVGVLVYVAWRSTDVRLVGWFPESMVLAMRAFASHVPLPSVVLGSGPDLAWGWSFGAAMGIVWQGRPLSRKKLGWLLAGAAVASYAEIGQLWQLPPGRFDPIDLASIVLGYAIGVLLTSRSTSRKSTPSPSLRQPDRDQACSPSTRG